MPTKIRRLKESAIKSCVTRGHVMQKFRHRGLLAYTTVYKSICINCFMEVRINTDPNPNDIDISGEAVALNCRGPQED